MTKLTFKDLKQQLAKLQSNTNQDNRLDVLRINPFGFGINRNTLSKP